MKKVIFAVLLSATSISAVAGGSRASDLSTYFDAINHSIQGKGFKAPEWQTPSALRDAELPQGQQVKVDWDGYKRVGNKMVVWGRDQNGRRVEAEFGKTDIRRMSGSTVEASGRTSDGRSVDLVLNERTSSGSVTAWGR